MVSRSCSQTLGIFLQLTEISNLYLQLDVVLQVMAGSGDLRVLRLCRYLRTRIGVPTVTYGSHMAIHIALGLLFLGSGRCNFETSVIKPCMKL
mgnify:CR=1 FL=1